MDASLDYLNSRAYKSPDILLDARDLLGEQDAEARALLYRGHGWPDIQRARRSAMGAGYGQAARPRTG